MTRKDFTLSQRIALAVIPRLTAAILAAIGTTLRFEVIAEDGAIPSPIPAKGIFCFWHQCTLPCGWYFRKYRCTVLISRSFDGELIARTLELLGFETVRGSSSFGGAAVMLTMQEILSGGFAVAFTADGPRGPIYQTKMGPVKLAQITQREIGSFYLLPERAWTLNSWDRFLIPKPFSKVIVSWSRAVAPPAKDADAAMLEAKRMELNEAMERARLNADNHIALRSKAG
ncbi:lysophospholipid acyltransferase family protein [Alloacidobacterium sp.]|uniref:lysophospholipid acyltransferase family protein n=1 Tax=Alloacidobacterium sp. TaxID=2951999 RepID=UPI002D255EB1|nr:lysophospholipid acyltransferase family protein [Alloacidobacterium sp.]HYK37978.1 lysophospholipid acyltransferase family protein [Alloacidobacterium sp.]